MSPTTAKYYDLSPKELEARLVQAGIQPTAQRLAICRYVLCESDHPSAEDVKAWADKNFPKMSLATVYNTLKSMVEGGLLREFKFPHSDKVIYDNNVASHYHFLDEATGQLYDLTPEEVEVVTKLGKRFQIDQMEIVLRGRKKV